jgi:predicted ATP-binding protein involved in virulence
VPHVLEADSLACYVTAVYIKTLTAQNFRCFTDLQIDFQPGFNLLIGDNMSGKTAVLDALRICLNGYVNTFFQSKIDIEKLDARLLPVPMGDAVEMVSQSPASVLATVEFEQKFLDLCKSIFPVMSHDESVRTWGQTLASTKEGTVLTKKGGLGGIGVLAQSAISNIELMLPIFSFHSTNRNTQPIPSAQNEQIEQSALANRGRGYLNSLSHYSILQTIHSWIERRTMSEMQRKGRGLPLLAEGPLLGIERAVCTCLPEVKQFYFDFDYQQLAIVFADGRRLPVSMLSDGMLCVLSLALELAWRAVVLNPHLGAQAPERATGIVMIDELDLALHPTWQRRIVADLSRAFPRLQFIATTHSPQIIGSAKNALVQKIDGDKVQAVARPYGLDSNTLLTEVMGAQERDPAIVKLFEKVNDLMNDKRWDEARAALAQVTDQIDSLDTEVVDLRTRIDFLSRAAKRS